MTLARRHFEQASAAASEGTDLSALTAYQRLYKRLKEDKAVLKNIASIADKKQATPSRPRCWFGSSTRAN
ncbi:TPA: hypothetical protein ACM24S_000297 [Neisseria meningitidis]